MTESSANRILRLLDEIREAIVAEVGSGKNRSPTPPRPDEERRQGERRAPDDAVTAEVVKDAVEQVTQAMSDKVPPGKTFKRVKVTTETVVTSRRKQRRER